VTHWPASLLLSPDACSTPRRRGTSTRGRRPCLAIGRESRLRPDAPTPRWTGASTVGADVQKW
jgi:hypothetical protein